MTLPPEGALGRVAFAGSHHFCRFAAGRIQLLDRPGWEDDVVVADDVGRDDVRLLAPVVPGKIVAVGLNYHEHAEELQMAVRAEPILFMKPGTAVVGPGESIVRPGRSAQVDYEAELAVVMGRRGRNLTPAAAASCVAGYTCGNDVTARDLQRLDGQWTRAKSYDTFCPLGPWIVAETPSRDARVSATVDGVEVQHGLVGDMIVAPLDLVAFISGVMTLEPGDVIMTGTPPGVGPLVAGETVTIRVEGIGDLTNSVV